MASRGWSTESSEPAHERTIVVMIVEGAASLSDRPHRRRLYAHSWGSWNPYLLTDSACLPSYVYKRK
eukprot:52455-Eustigmatos_ZCMA.PRE.1